MHTRIPRVKLELGKMCKGKKNPRGLMDQFTNTVQYSTVHFWLFRVIFEEKMFLDFGREPSWSPNFDLRGWV